MSLSNLVSEAPHFRTHESVWNDLQAACADHHDARFHKLGESEKGRPLCGVVMGSGAHTVSLIAGNHADEPVGPETLRTFVIEGLRQREALNDLFERYRFVVVPHTNPDGEARNRPWIEAWPDPLAYAQHAVREEPGRDLEFGFPEMRRENRLVSDFLRKHGPYALHLSLHGMSVAEGAQLLIERHWTFRTQPLRDTFAEAARDAGLGLHDHNRKGEKGFFYIEPGFTTTPEGEAMRTFFRAQDDDAMANRFHDSSMEFVRSLGGDPLCLVTEIPLFHVEPDGEAPPGEPTAYLRLKERLPEIRLHLERGERNEAQSQLEPFEVKSVPLGTAMRLQFTALAAGLKTIAS